MEFWRKNTSEKHHLSLKYSNSPNDKLSFYTKSDYDTIVKKSSYFECSIMQFLPWTLHSALGHISPVKEAERNMTELEEI